MKPLMTWRSGAKEYSAYSAPSSVGTRTPSGVGVLNTPSACLAIGSTSAWRPVRLATRAIDCTAVPCAMPDTHGGRPPPKAKSYSHAIPPARGTRSASSSSSSAPMSGERLAHSWLSLAKFASGWNWRPCPGNHCHTSWEPGKEMRRLLGPLALADQYARLRSSVSHSGTSRGPVSRRRAAMPSTVRTAPASSERRVLRRGRRFTVCLPARSAASRPSRSETAIAPVAARRLSSLATVGFLAAASAAAGLTSDRATNAQHAIRREVMGPMLGSPPRDSPSASIPAVPARCSGAARLGLWRRQQGGLQHERQHAAREDLQGQQGRQVGQARALAEGEREERGRGQRPGQPEPLGPVPESGQAEAAEVQDRLRLRRLWPEREGRDHVDRRQG